MTLRKGVLPVHDEGRKIGAERGSGIEEDQL